MRTFLLLLTIGNIIKKNKARDLHLYYLVFAVIYHLQFKTMANYKLASSGESYVSRQKWF